MPGDGDFTVSARPNIMAAAMAYDPPVEHPQLIFELTAFHISNMHIYV